MEAVAAMETMTRAVRPFAVLTETRTGQTRLFQLGAVLFAKGTHLLAEIRDFGSKSLQFLGLDIGVGGEGMELHLLLADAVTQRSERGMMFGTELLQFGGLFGAELRSRVARALAGCLEGWAGGMDRLGAAVGKGGGRDGGKERGGYKGKGDVLGIHAFFLFQMFGWA